MRGIKPFKLGFVTRPFQWGAQHHLGVSVLGFFAFEPRGSILTDVEMWDVAAKAVGPIPLTDGIPKARAEFLVGGSCFAPGGRPTATCPVKVRVGRVEKTLYVVGDRYWLRDVPTEPRPFTEMPLDWARAFGGAGHDPNPLGKGVAPIVDDAGNQIHPLPNVELPGAMVRSPKDRPPPASFLPVDFSWPQRFSMAGTYDKEWLETRYPGFAKDLDWRIWNAASPDQQSEQFWVGDEPIVIENMHPEKSRIEAALPGLRGRAFITRRRAEGEPPSDVPADSDPSRLEEVALRLTTVWLFPEFERGIVVFEGAAQVTEDDGADVASIMVAAERLDQRLTLEHYRTQYTRRVNAGEEGNLAIFLDDSGLLPEDQLGFPPESNEQMEMLAVEGLQAKRAHAKADADIAAARARLEEMGLDPDEHGPRPMDPLPETPELSKLGEVFEEAMRRMKEEQEKAEKLGEEQMEKAAAKYAEMGLDFDEVREEVSNPRRGPPDYSAEAMLKTLREIADDAAAHGHPSDELEYYASSEEWRERLENTERQLLDTYRLAAHFQQPAFPMEAGPAAELKAELAETALRERSLAGRDLTGADLSELDLRGVDLRGCLMESANLERADLREARLDQVVLAHADLTGAVLDGAVLAGANLGRAKLATASFVGVDLTEAVLWEADLRGAILQGTRLAGVTLIQVKLQHADLTAADLSSAILFEVAIDKAKLTGANLSSIIGHRLDLRGVDVGGACFDKANLVDCGLDGASLVNASMKGLVMAGEYATARKADFKGAQLQGANLRGVDLTGSDFSGANLSKADLSEATLQGARFYRAVAKESMWVKADLRQAFMVSIDMLRAIVQKADIRGTDLRGANLYAADFALVRSDAKTNVTDANQGKVRTLPLRGKP